MRNILMAGAVAFVMVSVASAQSSTPQAAGTQYSATHKKPASKHSSRNAGAVPGTNVSGATSDKGKGTMPENPNAKKGTVGGTTGMPGSGPNASGSDNK